MIKDEQGIQKLKEVYARRQADPSVRKRYTLFEPGNLFLLQSREREILRTLRMAGMTELAEKRILDVGCGTGSELRRFLEYGALPENLYGVDLLPDRVELARRLNPALHLECLDAQQLPYDDQTFDLVLLFTVFSSVLSDSVRQAIAEEVLRVLRPGGAILWYDFWLNPTNPDTRGVSLKEIKKLFPGCRYRLKRVTLAPPLARRLVPFSYLLATLLEKIPWLCTHYLGLILKPEV